MCIRQNCCPNTFRVTWNKFVNKSGEIEGQRSQRADNRLKKYKHDVREMLGWKQERQREQEVCIVAMTAI